MASEDLDDLIEMELSRVPTSVGGPCDSCSVAPKLVLVANFSRNYLTLCPECEGEFLSKLLRNYLRRQSNQSKAGFTGPLVKEEAAKDSPNGTSD